MNPIQQQFTGFLRDGKELVSVRPNDPSHPKSVIFEFADGTTSELPANVDHETFMDWWHQTSRWFNAVKRVKFDV
jgi:hypothetical protein